MPCPCRAASLVAPSPHARASSSCPCPGPAAAAGREWPRWRGPNRDGIAKETGLLHEWKAGGPPLAWKASGMGVGFSSLAVVRRSHLHPGRPRRCAAGCSR